MPAAAGDLERGGVVGGGIVDDCGGGCGRKEGGASLPAERRGGAGMQCLHHCRTAHNLSASALRKKSDLTLVSKVPFAPLRGALSNLQEVLLGTKLFVLLPAVPLAVAAACFNFGPVWLFALSLIGLAPLAERLSFLTEQISFYTGPTVGGLLNATCGNATELIIAVFALRRGKIEVVKHSLLGSVLSNLLLVLGTSLFLGGVANLGRDQLFLKKQADVSTGLLYLAALCHLLPLGFRYAAGAREIQLDAASAVLTLSRICSIVMLVAYTAYLFFQLATHLQLFEPVPDDADDGEDDIEEEAVMGWPSAVAWLIAMTLLVAVLSEYVVSTIEVASDSWGLSVGFVSVILLPIVGNAAEHASAVIFAFKDKLDITLGVSLGSAAQISMFVIPVCVVVGWIIGVDMDLDFKLLETCSLLVAVLVTAFTLQDGTSHYLKGLLLLLCYFAVGACFFLMKTAPNKPNGGELVVPGSSSS